MKLKKIKLVLTLGLSFSLCSCSLPPRLVTEVVSYVKNAKEGTEEKRAVYKIKPVIGRIDIDFWDQLSSAVAKKSNCLFYFDFSKVKIQNFFFDCKVPTGIFNWEDCIGGMVLPQGILGIYYNSFSYCNNLEMFSFGDNKLIRIFDGVCDFCPKLKTVIIKDYDDTYYCASGFYKSGNETPEGITIYAPDYFFNCKDMFKESKVKEVRTPSRNYSFSDWINKK